VPNAAHRLASPLACRLLTPDRKEGYMDRRDGARGEFAKTLTDGDLDRVIGGQGIDIVRMPPQPKDPNEDFIVSDRQPFVD
jgi:hypothetical protein